MKRFFLYPIRGITASLIFALGTLITALSIIIFAGLCCLIPIKKWRHRGMLWVQKFPVYWMDLLVLLIPRSKWDIQGSQNLRVDQSYLLISNHCSWLDILVLGYTFRHKTPVLKFFMKKELLWQLPLAGLACYVLGYPFMERHTSSQVRKNPELKGKDIETVKKACQKFRDYPSTVMNYVEGTRFTVAKRERSHSPYENLLKPKVGGIAVVSQELQHDLAGILDATIVYQPEGISLWKFFCGDFDKIICHYDIHPITQDLLGDYYGDRIFRKRIQAWLNELWQAKDQKIQQLRAQQ